jgi:SAM-dependent methyltransferase
MPNTTMSELWNGAFGEPWVKAADRYDGMLTGLGQLALDAAALQPGESVLDVGCGSGQLSRQAAALVGPTGKVTGVDISEHLVALAGERSAEPGESYQVGDAQDMALPPSAFDVVLSRFGVMFFDDPVAAFTNLRQATAAGGRLSMVVWQSPLVNPWVLTTLTAFVPHLGPPTLPPPGAPGPFAFADEARVRSVLADAGWQEVTVTPVETTVLVGGPGTLEEAIAFTTSDGFAKVMLAGASPEAREAAVQELRAAAAPSMTDEGLRLGAAVFVVQASSS